jgi:pyrimidine operon attenuation protein/uracil phosphoribosyltransferase
MENQGRVILSSERFHLTIERLCQQLIEEYNDFTDTCLIAIQPKGRFLGDRIMEQLENLNAVGSLQYGLLDITFYRDDFRLREKPLKASFTKIDFLVEGKRVILLDDVLYSGRTVQAALTALNHYGRPREVELLCFVDRRFNRQLPIQADFVGITVDALDEAYVRVEWAQIHGEDKILLFPNKQTSEKTTE